MASSAMAFEKRQPTRNKSRPQKPPQQNAVYVTAEANLSVDFYDGHARIEELDKRGIGVDVDDDRLQIVLN